MPKFEKSKPETIELIAELTKTIKCDKRTMFGYPCYFLNGNMFTGLFGDQVFFRLPVADQEKLKKKYPLLSVFEPIKGRAMKEYLSVSEGLKTEKSDLKKLLSLSYEYASSLPKKKKKEKK